VYRPGNVNTCWGFGLFGVGRKNKVSQTKTPGERKGKGDTGTWRAPRKDSVELSRKKQSKIFGEKLGQGVQKKDKPALPYSGLVGEGKKKGNGGGGHPKRLGASGSKNKMEDGAVVRGDRTGEQNNRNQCCGNQRKSKSSFADEGWGKKSFNL